MRSATTIVTDFRARVRHALTPRPVTDLDLYRASVRATRGRVLAEALVLIVIGFSLDDLHVLRVPGFAVGLAAAVTWLTLGGFVHARRLTARLQDVPDATAREHLHAHKGRGRAAALVAGLVFLAWLAVFSEGVPPWAA